MLIGWVVIMWFAAMALSAWAESELEDWQAQEFGRRGRDIRYEV